MRREYTLRNRVEHCYGRDRELDALHQNLSRDRSVTLIKAPARMGKTTLIRTFTHEVRKTNTALLGHVEITDQPVNVFLYVISDLFAHIYQAGNWEKQWTIIKGQLIDRCGEDGLRRLSTGLLEALKAGASFPFVGPISQSLVSLGEWVVKEAKELELGRHMDLPSPSTEEVLTYIDSLLNIFSERKLTLVLDNYNYLTLREGADQITLRTLLEQQHNNLHLILTWREEESNLEILRDLESEIQSLTGETSMPLRPIEDEEDLKGYISATVPNIAGTDPEASHLALISRGHPGVVSVWGYQNPSSPQEAEDLARQTFESDYRTLTNSVESLRVANEQAWKSLFYLCWLPRPLSTIEDFSKLVNEPVDVCENILWDLKNRKIFADEGWFRHSSEKEYIRTHLSQRSPSISSQALERLSIFFESQFSYHGIYTMDPFSALIGTIYYAKRLAPDHPRTSFYFNVLDRLTGIDETPFYFLEHSYWPQVPFQIRPIIMAESIKWSYLDSSIIEEEFEACFGMILEQDKLDILLTETFCRALTTALGHFGKAGLRGPPQKLLDISRQLAGDDRLAIEPSIQEQYIKCLTGALVFPLEDLEWDDVDDLISEIRNLAKNPRWVNNLVIQEGYALSLVGYISKSLEDQIWKKSDECLREMRLLAKNGLWDGEINIQRKYAIVISYIIAHFVEDQDWFDLEELLDEIRRLATQGPWVDDLEIQECYAGAFPDSIVFFGKRQEYTKVQTLLGEVRDLASNDQWVNKLAIQEPFAQALANVTSVLASSESCRFEEIGPIIEEMRLLANHEHWINEPGIKVAHVTTILNSIRFFGNSQRWDDLHGLLGEVRRIARQERWTTELPIQATYARCIFNALNSFSEAQLRNEAQDLLDEIRRLAHQEHWMAEIEIQEPYAKSISRVIDRFIADLSVNEYQYLLDEIRGLAQQEYWVAEATIQAGYALSLIRGITGFAGRREIEHLESLMEETKTLARQEDWAHDPAIQASYAASVTCRIGVLVENQEIEELDIHLEELRNLARKEQWVGEMRIQMQYALSLFLSSNALLIAREFTRLMEILRECFELAQFYPDISVPGLGEEPGPLRLFLFNVFGAALREIPEEDANLREAYDELGRQIRQFLESLPDQSQDNDNN